MCHCKQNVLTFYFNHPKKLAAAESRESQKQLNFSLKQSVVRGEYFCLNFMKSV